jgi:septation ring formation regulator EzrA
MKQHIRNIIGSALVVSVLAFTPVAAAVNNANSGQAPNASSSSSDDSAKSTDGADDAPSHDLKDRLENLRKDLKINLSAERTNRLKQHCKAAQTVLGTTNNRLGNSITTRSKAYANVSTKLARLIDRLKAANVDTTALQQQATALNSKIAVYTADLATYKQSLTDLKSLDCVTDPAAFETALQISRAAHDTLVTDTTAIKDYVANTIRPTLQAIATELKAKETPATTTKPTTEAQ